MQPQGASFGETMPEIRMSGGVIALLRSLSTLTRDRTLDIGGNAEAVESIAGGPETDAPIRQSQSAGVQLFPGSSIQSVESRRIAGQREYHSVRHHRRNRRGEVVRSPGRLQRRLAIVIGDLKGVDVVRQSSVDPSGDLIDKASPGRRASNRIKRPDRAAVTSSSPPFHWKGIGTGVICSASGRVKESLRFSVSGVNDTTVPSPEAE